MILQDSWIIAKKELRLLFKSTRRILLLLTTPLILFLFFGLMMIIVVPMLSTVDKPIEVIVIQDDNGAPGINWGEQYYTLLKSTNLTKDFNYVNKSVNELDSILESTNFSILLYIPANFTEVINSSVPAQFFLYYDNTEPKSEGAVSSMLTVSQVFNQLIIFYEHGEINLNNIFTIPEPTSPDKGIAGMIASTITIIPLYAILLLVFPSLSLVLISVTIEREQKTLESLILQPIERKSIITGKLLYGAILIGVNTMATLISIITLISLGYFFLPDSIKSAINPMIESIITNSDITVWIFLVYMIIGLIIVSLLTITAAVLFSLLAKDEREANMVTSALIIIPMVSTLLIAFFPIEMVDNSIQIILVLLPLLGYLFAIYISLISGEIPIIAWLSLVAQFAWIIIGVWVASRLIESEGILEISYKRIFRFRRK